MNRIQSLNHRYANSAAVARNGVEIIAIGDPVSARFNGAARKLMGVVRDDGPGLWDDLLGAVRVLRWRSLTQPQPIVRNQALRDGALQVLRHVNRLRGAVANDSLLDELASAATAMGDTDPVLGPVLVRSIEEVGATECVVVAAGAAASSALSGWLNLYGVHVLTTGHPGLSHPWVEQSYVVGPPRFFRSSLVTAPLTSGVTFLMPAWFGDREVPRSAISAYADGAIHIAARVFTEGDLSEPESMDSDDGVAEDEFLPQPLWGQQSSPDREPNSDEVEARKLLLSGGRALWLDDGDRIRAVDPLQPVGERVVYVDVASMREGTYLLLRHGETEHRAMYSAALAQLGSRGPSVDASQQKWKQTLRERLQQHGHRAVARMLRSQGIKTAERAPAWTEPDLVRPHSDHDFEQLLTWLGLHIQPYFGNATLLRRAIYQASAELREQLETAVSAADLSVLERDGYLSLDVKADGFRGVLATRVLAISPFMEIVPRHDVRVPFTDRSGQWLE